MSHTPATLPADATEAEPSHDVSEVYDIADRYVDAARRARPVHRDRRRHHRPRPRDDRLLARGQRERASTSRATRSRALDAAPQDDGRRPARRARDARSAASCDVDFARRAGRPPAAAHHRQPGAGGPAVLRPDGFETDDDWDSRDRAHGRACPTRSASIEATLREGVARGVVAARRQALACAEQADDVGRRRSQPFFRDLARAPPDDAAPRGRGRRGDRRVRAARRVPRATSTRRWPNPRDPGRPRPLHAVRRRVQRHRSRPRRDVRVGLGRAAPHRSTRCSASASASSPASRSTRSIDHLDHDPTRTIEGVDAFQRWNQELIDHDDRRAERHALRHRASRCSGARR